MTSITDYYDKKSSGNKPGTNASPGGSITSYFEEVSKPKRDPITQNGPPLELGQAINSGGLTFAQPQLKVIPSITQYHEASASGQPLPQTKISLLGSGQTLTQAQPEQKNVWDKAKDFIGKIFYGNEKTQAINDTARAQNAYQVQKVAGQKLVEEKVKKLAADSEIPYDEAQKAVENLARQKGISVYDVVGLGLNRLAEPGGNPFKASLMEEVSKDLGIRTDPSNKDLTDVAMSLGLALGLTEAPLATIKALGLFSGVNEIKSGLISAIKGEGFKLGAGKTLSDVFENAGSQEKVLLDLIDFMGTGAITGAVFKASPQIAERLTKDVITKYKLPEKISIPAEVVKDVVIGKNTGVEAERLAELGLSSTEWREAVKFGRDITVPAEKLVTITDKPYWAKLKELIGKPVDESINVTKFGEPTSQNRVSGLLKTPEDIKVVAKEAGIRLPEAYKNPIEQKSIEAVVRAPQELVNRYIEKFGTVINADKSKEMFEGYNGTNASDYNQASGILSGLTYDKLLKEKAGEGNNTVLFTGGGPGSGKTTATKGEQDNYPIIYDSTISNFNLTKERIDKALKAGYTVDMKYVYRPVEKAYKEGVLRRYLTGEPRTVPLNEVIGGHEGARNTALKLYKEYLDNPNVNFSFFDNSGGLEDVKMISVDEVKEKQYNKEELTKQLYDYTEQLKQQGKLTEDQSKALLEGSKREFPKVSTEGNSERQQPITEGRAKQVKGRSENTVQGLRETIASANSPQEVLKNLNTFVDNYIRGADKYQLADLRAGLVKEVTTLTGGTGYYKKDYAMRVALRDDAEIGDLVRGYEDHIAKIDELIPNTAEKPEPVVPPEKKTPIKEGGKIESQNPVGEGKPKDSKAYSRVRDRLQEETRMDVTYNRLNLEKDAENAMKYITEKPNEALQVAFGLKSPPQGQTETAISIALADKAGRDGLYKLQSQLEASRSLRQTRRGQEIVSERGRFNDDSPYRYIQELMDRRLKRLGANSMSDVKEVVGEKTGRKKRGVEKIDKQAKQLKEQLTTEQVKIKRAQDIIDSLTC